MWPVPSFVLASFGGPDGRDAPPLHLQPEFLGLVSGLIVGFVLVRTIGHRHLSPKIYLLLSLAMAYIVYQYGWWSLEARMVEHLAEFFASSQFALGAVIGGVLAIPHARLR